jgi:hypothetical protein
MRTRRERAGGVAWPGLPRPVYLSSGSAAHLAERSSDAARLWAKTGKFPTLTTAAGMRLVQRRDLIAWLLRRALTPPRAPPSAGVWEEQDMLNNVVSPWEMPMTTPSTPPMPSLEKIAAALGLPAKASPEDLVSAFRDWVESMAGPARTAPQQLTELVEEICATEHVSFNEGLARAKQHNAALGERVAEYYARGR